MDLIRHYIGWLPRLAAEHFVRRMKIYPEHQHERLKKDMSIRIVRLKPLSWDGLIHCTVEEVELPKNPQEEPRDPYDALSYAWWLDSDIGDPRQGKQRAIICNGMLLPVYENLYNALLQLQRDAVGVALWIDAICMDQKTDNSQGQGKKSKEIREAEEERKQQIKMMGKIFRSARKVIVWLGRDTLVMRFALWRAESFFTGDHGKFFDRVDSRNWLLKLLAMLDGCMRLLALRWILCKGWFSRVWTLQEMILATDIVFVLGARSLDIFGLLDHEGPNFAQLGGQSISQRTESQHGDYGSNMRGLLFARNARQDVLNGLEYPIFEALFETRSRRCTRPLDKVFALFSMASETKESGGIEARYDKSVEEVYSECAAKFLKDPRYGAYFLSMVGQIRRGCADHPLFPTSSTRHLLKGISGAKVSVDHGPTKVQPNPDSSQAKPDSSQAKPDSSQAKPKSSQIKLAKRLPSWVPDLTTQVRPYPLCHLSMAGFCAGSDEPSSIEFSGPIRFLHLKAAKLDTITKIGNCQERKLEADINDRWYVFKWWVGRYGPVQQDMTDTWEVALELGTLYRHTDESVMSAFIKTLLGGETHFLCKKDHPEDGETYRKVEITQSDFTDWFISEIEKTVLDSDIPPEYILHILGEEDCLTPHEQKVIVTEAEKTNCTIKHLKERRRHVNALSRFIATFDNDEYKIRERLKHLYEEIKSGRIKGTVNARSFWKEPPFKSVLDRHYLHRRHFCTRDGYIGSGPWTVEEGDVVMIVAGGYVPYIFRKSQPGSDKWKLIGEAYCHGVMHGEAVKKGDLNFEIITVI